MYKSFFITCWLNDCVCFFSSFFVCIANILANDHVEGQAATTSRTRRRPRNMQIQLISLNHVRISYMLFYRISWIPPLLSLSGETRWSNARQSSHTSGRPNRHCMCIYCSTIYIYFFIIIFFITFGALLLHMLKFL